MLPQNLLTLLLLALSSGLEAYKILIFYPTPSFSHQRSIMSLTERLVKEGHELFVISPNAVSMDNGEWDPHADRYRAHIWNVATWDPCRALPTPLTEQVFQTEADTICGWALIYFQRLPAEEQRSCPFATGPALCRRGISPERNTRKCSFMCGEVIAPPRRSMRTWSRRGRSPSPPRIEYKKRDIRDIVGTVERPPPAHPHNLSRRRIMPDAPPEGRR